MTNGPYAGETERSFSGRDFRNFGQQVPRVFRHWAPVELVAMILGFVFFWPVGLAILGYKLMQRKWARQDHAFAGPMAFGCRSPDDRKEWKREWKSRGRDWAAREWGPRPSGNSAFDDWRNAELARLEEERRKLAAAQAEFEAHLDNLRRAKDRVEFESFLAARRNAAPPANPATPAS